MRGNPLVGFPIETRRHASAIGESFILVGATYTAFHRRPAKKKYFPFIAPVKMPFSRFDLMGEFHQPFSGQLGQPSRILLSTCPTVAPWQGKSVSPARVQTVEAARQLWIKEADRSFATEQPALFATAQDWHAGVSLSGAS